LRRVRRLVLVVAGASLLLAACGGSGSTSAGSSTTTSSGSSASTGTSGASNRAADKAASSAAVLKLSDFPSGWTSTPRSSNTSVPAVDKQLAQCLHVSVSLLDSSDPSNVDSPDFNGPNNATVDDSVSFAANQGQAQQAFTVLSEPQAPQCLSTALNSYVQYSIAHPTSSSDTLPAGTTFGQVTAASLSFPTIGDKSVAYRVTIPVTAEGQQIAIYVDFIVSGKGRAGSILTGESVNTTPDTSLEQQLQSAVIGRISAA